MMRRGRERGKAFDVEDHVIENVAEKGGKPMSERKTDFEEKEYADAIPDDETTERPEADEETYRDGSVKHECW